MASDSESAADHAKRVISSGCHAGSSIAQLILGLVLGACYERAFFARHRMFIPVALLNSFFILIALVRRLDVRSQTSE